MLLSAISLRAALTFPSIMSLENFLVSWSDSELRPLYSLAKQLWIVCPSSSKLDLHLSTGLVGAPDVLCVLWFSTLRGVFEVIGQVESLPLSMPLLRVLSFLHKPGTVVRARGQKLLLLSQMES